MDFSLADQSTTLGCCVPVSIPLKPPSILGKKSIIQIVIPTMAVTWNTLPTEMKLAIFDVLEGDDLRAASKSSISNYRLCAPALFKVSRFHSKAKKKTKN
jgi:hypothetical protein